MENVTVPGGWAKPARRGREEKRRPWERSGPRRPVWATPGAAAGGRPAGGRRSWTAFPILPECPNVCSAQPGSACVRVYVSACVSARVCACVCAAGAPRRVEAHSLMRAGTERQHCSFPRTPAASRAATCERRAGSGASSPGTAPLPARRRLRAAPAAPHRTVSTGRRARPATRKLCRASFNPLLLLPPSQPPRPFPSSSFSLPSAGEAGQLGGGGEPRRPRGGPGGWGWAW